MLSEVTLHCSEQPHHTCAENKRICTVHYECYLYTGPPIATSHRQTEDDTVCQPQLHQEKGPAFCISKKEHLILVLTNTDTPLFLQVSATARAPPTPVPLNFLIFLCLHATPSSSLCIPPAHALSSPPSGHPNCPC